MSEHDQGDEQQDKPQRRRRRTVDERLGGMLEEKRTQLARLKAREDALTSTLSHITSERQKIYEELARLEAACGE